MSLLIDAACGSHIGKIRSNNEDNFLFADTVLPEENNGQNEPLSFCCALKDDICLAVFDGMGGGEFGEVASYTAAAELRGLVRRTPHPSDVTAFLTECTETLNRSVFTEAEHREARQMGATESVLWLRGSSVYACNVGDSRIFGLRDDRFLQISQDHTDEAFLREHGILRKPHLTQYLGMNPAELRIEPHTVHAELRAGDIYLICSDGLTDMVGEDRIREILGSAGLASACVTALIAEALQNGGKDNVTVTVCRVLEGASDGDTDTPQQAAQTDAPAESGAVPFLKKIWSTLTDPLEPPRSGKN